MVEDSIVEIVSRIMDAIDGDWDLFNIKIKREFSVKDKDRLTRAIFMSWVMSLDKKQEHMELL